MVSFFNEPTIHWMPSLASAQSPETRNCLSSCTYAALTFLAAAAWHKPANVMRPLASVGFDAIPFWRVLQRRPPVAAGVLPCARGA
jgi:hypothetical protein